MSNRRQISSLTGWGRYPRIAAQVHTPTRQSQAVVENAIPRGAGRSYGDSALAYHVLSGENLNRFVSFEEHTGMLTCDAGVTLDEILKVFVPKGWFLCVTPGTKFVTVGGAVASDVHGKNHHLHGCFSQYVKSFTVQIGEQSFLCSPEQNSDLFHATCGGMGLTGLIVEVTFQLRKIDSAFINQTTIKTRSLAESLELFEQYADSVYSVAWIDCLATGESLGRSLLTVGDHAEAGALSPHTDPKLNVPFSFPEFALNPLSIQAFNHLYYGKERRQQSTSAVHYNSFFYPLDGINNWNRMYGQTGFTQYQFVLPKDAGLEGMAEVLRLIADSKQGSFLAVLKAFGKANANYLSFPLEGYTLALDFKITHNIWSLLQELDNVVLNYGGRVYLTKDARMSESFFKASYPQWAKLSEVREKYGATQYFSSLQSQRLGIY